MFVKYKLYAQQNKAKFTTTCYIRLEITTNYIYKKKKKSVTIVYIVYG